MLPRCLLLMSGSRRTRSVSMTTKKEERTPAYFEVQLDLEMRMMWTCLLMIICGVSVIESSPCRQAGSTLFCTEKWDGEVRIGVSRLVVREWDRQWCGDGSLELMLFGRDVSCTSFSKQCSYEAMKVNGEICRIMVRKKKEDFFFFSIF